MQPPPVRIFSFSLSPRVTLTLFSKVFFLPALTFIQTYHWFSEVKIYWLYIPVQLWTHCLCDLRQLPNLS